MSDRRTNSYVFNPEDPTEMARLINLDRATTQAMGGPLAGLPDLPDGAQVLDLGCGPGGWVLDVAFERPDIEVAGVDISQVMTDYANARARSQQLSNASFGVMDMRQPLDFSDTSFHLINARFLIAAIYRDVWPSLLRECHRILLPSGLIRLTEPVNGGETNSPAFERMQALICQAGKQMGYGFSLDGRSFGMSYRLPRLLRQAGFHDIAVKTYTQDVSWEAQDAWGDFHRNSSVAYQLAQPVLVKQGLVSSEEVFHLYQQMEIEMHQHEFAGMWYWISATARKPGTGELEETP